MPVRFRAAQPSDTEVMVDLLLQDAEQRRAVNPTLWKLDDNARDKVRSTVGSAMQNDNPPFRQQWLLAEFDGEVIGLTHTILLPVPPIYAGEFGAPGLIMEDCFVADSAPEGTQQSLLKAAEADLVEAGAKILVASSAQGGPWEAEYAAQGYQPLTLYFAKTDLRDSPASEGVRAAQPDDVPAIVASSAINRRILHDLHNTFWKPHPEANARFGSWMDRSLTLPDRDMFVSERGGDVDGYAISQPATALHFPAAHDVAGTGFIDDYFHSDFENPDRLGRDGLAATALLNAAESALQSRGNNAVLLVCPAAWSSKIVLLEKAGYSNAITWFIKT
ncbi:hypothetical protein [Aliiroseovarius sp. YM-037]|uniref:hypothetical protein n=1 Tax=Aliiroseovarius sp. YM-037 TaxID=3341728 RepID=UPI003A80487A